MPAEERVEGEKHADKAAPQPASSSNEANERPEKERHGVDTREVEVFERLFHVLGEICEDDAADERRPAARRVFASEQVQNQKPANKKPGEDGEIQGRRHAKCRRDRQRQEDVGRRMRMTAERRRFVLEERVEDHIGGRRAIRPRSRSAVFHHQKFQ